MKRTWRILLHLLAAFALAAPATSAAEPFRIAAIYAKTGQATQQNLTSLQGVRMAVREINENGGLLGKPVELVELDNLSTAIGSKVAAEEAVRQGVTAIVGASWSSHSLAMARVAQEHGVPMITNISTSPTVTAVGDYIFRVCHTDDFQGWVMAGFAYHDIGADTAVVLVDIGEDFSLSLTRAFRTRFEALGGRVVQEIPYRLKQPDYREVAMAAKASGARVCFIPGHDESGGIAALLQEVGAPCTPLGGDGWGSGKFFPLGGSKLKLGYYTTHWHKEDASPRSRAFVARCGMDGVDASVALAYDAVMLLSDAVRRAGMADRKAIRDALAATRAYPGVTGTITFDKRGDPRKKAVIVRIMDGQAAYHKDYEPE